MTKPRIPILYLAPWVDFGGSDKGTIDWFRWIDRSVFAPSLITTQPSENRRLQEIVPFAEEVWALPDLLPGSCYGPFLVEFIASRRIELVHVMNARIGFDLLPDLRALPRPPRIVVQLHVEEPARDGYVRYVTTRYGNLVDAFSVTGQHLAQAVHDYGVSRDRINVIPTGVDAESEFSPHRVAPRAGLDPDFVHLLYPGRLVEQKDPLLMVEVARELQRRGLRFRIHVVGHGVLESAVRERVHAYSLASRISFEPPSPELAAWYAAVDLVLMTSQFEGVPYIIYEAMAMGLPVVAPALAGNVELMGEVGGTLVAPRDDPRAYADALEPLIADRELRRRVAAGGRERVLERFTLRDMADRHAALYRELIGGGPPIEPSTTEPAKPPLTPHPLARVSFPARPRRGTPLVTVLTPCFNHGRELRRCIASVRAQAYEPVEMIVIDDGSTESETIAVLAELERAADVSVLRMDANSGPSAARNRGLQEARGRYILPLDADNLLPPEALAQLVTQLQGAGEHIGYVYPSIQFVGNREDRFDARSFNLWLLTQGNYIDTAALIDRDVFDHGLGYSEQIRLGHEDWDFFLTLAAHGIYGVPAPQTHLIAGKHGFTRSALVKSAALSREWLGEPHRSLFEADRRLRARWAPTLTLIALAPVAAEAPAWNEVVTGLCRQHFVDFELLAMTDHVLGPAGLAPRVRTLPSRLSGRAGEALAHALELTDAPHIVVTYGTGAQLLSDPGSIERIVRVLEHGSTSGVLAFADAPRDGRFDWSSIPGTEPHLEPHTLAWSRRHRLLRRLPAGIDREDPVGDLARWRQLQRVSIQWRHLPLPSSRCVEVGSSRVPLVQVPRSRGDISERRARLELDTNLPGHETTIPRWAHVGSWMPPAMNRLVRYKRLGAEEWRVTSDGHPQEEFELDHLLGLLHSMSFEGCKRLVSDRRYGYQVLERGGQPDGAEMDRTLGYVEQVAFPLLEPLLLCRHGATGVSVLICGEDDPLRGAVEWPPLAALGFIERWPAVPHVAAVPGETTAWLRGLVRTVDLPARRHRVAVGHIAAGQFPFELGALLDRDPGGGVPLWIDEHDRLHTDSYAPPRFPFRPRRAIRWMGAPARWSDVATPLQRARAVARRSLQAAQATRLPAAAPMTAGPSPADGWLLPDAGPHRVAIISAVHPVTHDQLVTRDPGEVRDLGYESPRILGYALTVAPVTGTLAPPVSVVPWGSRFGRAVTRVEDPAATMP